MGTGTGELIPAAAGLRYRMRARRLKSWVGFLIAAVSLTATTLVVVAWVRSYRSLDQCCWQRLVFDATPRNAPPDQYEFSREPRKVYPPGTVSWNGRCIGWRLSNLRGRLLLRIDEVSMYYERPEPTAELRPLLGWSHTVDTPDTDITYNVPRGNLWYSWRGFNWNGLATWETYMDGESARMVMAPHWVLLLAVAAPGVVVLGAVAWRRLRRRPGHCRVCGYNLVGVSGVCPECGTGRGERA